MNYAPTKVNASFEEKQADTVTIEVRPHLTGGYIGTRRETNDAPFESVVVPRWMAEACRLLDHRKEFGAHISKIGGLDALAEFAMRGVRVLTKAFDGRGTGRNEVWAVPRCDFRFSADR